MRTLYRYSNSSDNKQQKKKQKQVALKSWKSSFMELRRNGPEPSN